MCIRDRTKCVGSDLFTFTMGHNFVHGFYASLKFYTCVSLGVSVANNRAEIHKDWEWIEQNLMETLGGFIEQDSFFERYLTIEAILDSLNCKLVILSSYQFAS